jgi:uncharacterized membrane protein HdeD (DUF308 family)
MILQRLAKNWWVFVLRGVLAILFGLGTLVMPGITLAALILLYAIYALGDGIVAAIAAFTQRRQGEAFPWSVLLIGLVSIAAGVVTFMYPGLTALILLYLIAGWCIVRGIFEIIVAVHLRKEIQREGWLIASGVISVLFGLFLFARPGAGALVALWAIASFAILYGIIAIVLGFKLKGIKPAGA